MRRLLLCEPRGSVARHINLITPPALDLSTFPRALEDALSGGDVAAEYIATQFGLYGMKPAGDNGTFMQKVPLVGITGAEARPLTVTKGAQKRTFKWADEVVAWTNRVTGTVLVEHRVDHGTGDGDRLETHLVSRL